MARLPPFLRRQDEDRRPRYLAGLVRLGEHVQLTGEGTVVVEKECLFEQTIKLLPRHMCHRDEAI
ncbi:hypothetical protein GCM10009555_014130 [Acrocarpospora macrocephala]|uniref:Uncharacterized protein n=1 Tax=Acrocarpospora macrocephala TaxID=150177 RepID=A0A5M3WLV6_9ACTN|nr:hypothetical protein Amac_018160 [Acrocarpospora macrocephala]